MKIGTQFFRMLIALPLLAMGGGAATPRLNRP